MKRAMLIISVFIILIIISGCDMQGDSQANKEEVYKGTSGLEMSFVPSNPPSEIFEGSPMVVLVEYANRGANTITDGSLYLTGYDSSYLFRGSGGVKSWSLRGLRGKSLLNPVGEEKLAEFRDDDVRKPDNVDRFTQKLKLTACYDYVTTASAQVCIDPDPHNLGGGTKTCSPGIVSLSGGQGAPVAVTKIDERIAGNRVQFKIYFKNVGGGEVFVGSTSHCYSNLQYDDMNKVVVNKVSFSNKNIQCEPSLGTPIRLNNGEGFTICYHEGDLGEDEYLTNLNIELKYSYRDSITKTVDILDVPGVSAPGGTTSSGSSGSGICGDMCAKEVGHADAPWCYCSRSGSCPSGYRAIGNSADGCTPCCVKT